MGAAANRDPAEEEPAAGEGPGGGGAQGPGAGGGGKGAGRGKEGSVAIRLPRELLAPGASAFDEANAFSVISTPRWMWAWMAVPPLQAKWVWGLLAPRLRTLDKLVCRKFPYTASRLIRFFPNLLETVIFIASVIDGLGNLP